MSRYSRGYGQASSWYSKGWAPSKNTYSGWSKRAPRGYFVHEWAESASKISTQTTGVQPETWADAEVEIVDERDKNQRKAVRQQTPLGTLREMLLQRGVPRLGEFHLLNSRKRSINATYKKNTHANDKAHDLNQKSIQALDVLTAEYVAFEATMAFVTSEHEAGYVLHAATLEVAEELERTEKDQGRLQDDLDCSCDDLAATTKEFPTVGQPTRLSRKFATDVQLMR